MNKNCCMYTLEIIASLEIISVGQVTWFTVPLEGERENPDTS